MGKDGEKDSKLYNKYLKYKTKYFRLRQLNIFIVNPELLDAEDKENFWTNEGPRDKFLNWLTKLDNSFMYE